MGNAAVFWGAAILASASVSPSLGQTEDARETPETPVLFLVQGPNQLDGVFSDADCDSCQGGAQVAAENFFWYADVCMIELWGGYLPGVAPPQDSFRVVFHQDAGGLPGPVLGSYTGLTGQRFATGRTVLGVDEYHYRLDLDPAMELCGSVDYWVEIYNDTQGSAESFFWETGDLDPVYGLPGHAVALEAPGSTWRLVADSELAVALWSGCGVSTLSGWGLLVLAVILFGAAGLALLRRTV